MELCFPWPAKILSAEKYTRNTQYASLYFFILFHLRFNYIGFNIVSWNVRTLNNFVNGIYWGIDLNSFFCIETFLYWLFSWFMKSFSSSPLWLTFKSINPRSIIKRKKFVALNRTFRISQCWKTNQMTWHISHPRLATYVYPWRILPSCQTCWTSSSSATITIAVPCWVQATLWRRNCVPRTFSRGLSRTQI